MKLFTVAKEAIGKIDLAEYKVYSGPLKAAGAFALLIASPVIVPILLILFCVLVLDTERPR